MPQGQDDKGAGAFDLGRAGAPPPPQTRNGKSPLVAGRAAEGQSMRAPDVKHRFFLLFHYSLYPVSMLEQAYVFFSLSFASSFCLNNHDSKIKLCCQPT